MSEEDKIKNDELKRSNAAGPPGGPATVDVTDASFNAFVNENPQAVIDFWAEWCYPCRIISPAIEELARDYKGKVTFGKLNVDVNRGAVAKFMVLGIPTLLVFKEGVMADRIIGAFPKTRLDRKLRAFLDV